MCLTTSALALFLTLVGPENVSPEDGRMIVHATTRDAHWVIQTGATHKNEDIWCTMAPQLDRMARISEAAAK